MNFFGFYFSFLFLNFFSKMKLIVNLFINETIWVIAEKKHKSMMENEDSELGSQSISSSGSEKMIVPKEPSHSHISSLKMSACGASATSDSAYGGSNTTQSQRSGSDKRSHSSKSQNSSNSSTKYVYQHANEWKDHEGTLNIYIFK